MAGEEVAPSEIFDLVVTGNKDGLLSMLSTSSDVSKLLELRDGRGRTCCALAAMLGKADCLAVLIDKGAKLDYKTYHGKGALGTL